MKYINLWMAGNQPGEYIVYTTRIRMYKYCIFERKHVYFVLIFIKINALLVEHCTLEKIKMERTAMHTHNQTYVHIKCG